MIKISSDHLKIVRTILAKYVSGCEVWAFGSRVNQEPKKHSDLDIVIKTDAPLPASIFANLRDAFSESDLPFKVDVVDWSRISESFRKIIEKKFEIIHKTGSS